MKWREKKKPYHIKELHYLHQYFFSKGDFLKYDVNNLFHF